MPAERRPSVVYNPEYRAILRMVKEARREAGMTQVEVARALGRPDSYVSKCERGDRRIDVEELAEFARVYDKPIDYFYGLTKRRKSPKPPRK